MDFQKFWESSKATIISAVIAIVVIGGLFVLFNALPGGNGNQNDENGQQEEQEENGAEKNGNGAQDEDKEDEDEAGEGKAKDLPAKYTIKSSDNLWKIAENQYGEGEKWAAIAAVNNIQNPNHVLAGSEITLPKAQDYTVKAGDTLWDIAEEFYKDGFQWNKIVAANPGKISTLPNGNVLIMAGQTIVVP